MKYWGCPLRTIQQGTLQTLILEKLAPLKIMVYNVFQIKPKFFSIWMTGTYVEFKFVALSYISLTELSVLMVFSPTGIYSFKIHEDVVLVPTFSQP